MLKIYQSKEQKTEEISLPVAFPFLLSGKPVVSLVGAGGKTTLLYELAWFCQKNQRKTLVTTTTHIYKPQRELLAESPKEAEALWKRGSIAVAGLEETGGEKLKMPEAAQLGRLLACADAAFIEADGAKHRPLKVPGETEPVILEQSNVVIGVAGLDAVGKKLEEVCFRTEETKSLLCAGSEHVITEEDVCRILCSRAGTKKAVGQRAYYIILHKCDTEERMEVGKRIISSLRDSVDCAGIYMTCRVPFSHTS